MQHTKNFADYSRPELAKKLALLGLDITFTRGDGPFLYYIHDENEVEILDLVGGYGALLWGHNHPALVKCMMDFLLQKCPNLAQMSIRKNTAILAEALSHELSNPIHPSYITTMVNTGAEAVETAIKHAALSRKMEIDDILNNISSQLSEVKHVYALAEIPVKINENLTIYSYHELRQMVQLHNEAQLSSFVPAALVADGAYHGKTIAALSLTANIYYQTPIKYLPQIRTITFPTDEGQLLDIIENEWIELYCPRINSKQEVKIERLRFNRIILLMIEPIRGEGGVLPFSADFLKTLRNLLDEPRIPLLVDEIQTGFYRCGYLSYLHSLGIYADYILLSKTMGGGLTKIGACSIGSNLFIPEFSMLHTSTFGDDELSGAVALESLSLGKVYGTDILSKAKIWKKHLTDLSSRHDEMCNVRCFGLMIGIEIPEMFDSNSYAFQIISRSGYLGYLASSFLLHRYQIRVSVTLSNPNTIRIHPPMMVDEVQIQYFVNAMDDLLRAIRFGDLYHIISHLLPFEFRNLRPLHEFESKNTPCDIGCYDQEVAFIVHYISSAYLPECEPSLSHLPLDMIESLLSMITDLNQPAILGRRIVKSITGRCTRVTFIGLPYSTEMIRKRIETSRRSIQDFRILCNKAIDICLDAGISTIGLGQFNSIAMRNGKDVISEQALITSGNSLTIYAGYAATLSYLDGKIAPSIAIVGAGGNIAITLSEMLLPYCKTMIIIGSSESSSNKISNHIDFLRSLDTETEIIGGWDIGLISQADIVLIATNAVSPFVDINHLKVGALVIDLSIPSNCLDSVKESADVIFVNGGLIKLPNSENLDITGIPLLTGQSFACLAETILMGMENCSQSYSYGDISIKNVFEMGAIAKHHGFEVSIPSNAKFKN